MAEVQFSAQAQRDIKRKLRILAEGGERGNVSHTCRRFGISRDTFYRWKREYAACGEAALVNSKPCPENPKLRTPADIEEKIIHLRTTYHLGQLRIAWYLDRYHGIKISSTGVRQVLLRHGLNRLPKNAKPRTVQTTRYEKQVPGHHVQVDVKFLDLQTEDGRRVRRFNTQPLMMQPGSVLSRFTRSTPKPMRFFFSTTLSSGSRFAFTP
jgi:transposase